MFERKTRNAFPAGNILLLAAVIAIMLWYLQKRLKEETPKPQPTEGFPVELKQDTLR
jgi:hypothetical protein